MSDDTGSPADTQRVISPCVGICRMSDDGVYCTGCLRTLHEIAAWSGASEDFKREVWRVLPERHLRLAGDS